MEQVSSPPILDVISVQLIIIVAGTALLYRVALAEVLNLAQTIQTIVKFSWVTITKTIPWLPALVASFVPTFLAFPPHALTE